MRPDRAGKKLSTRKRPKRLTRNRRSKRLTRNRRSKRSSTKRRSTQVKRSKYKKSKRSSTKRRIMKIRKRMIGGIEVREINIEYAGDSPPQEEYPQEAYPDGRPVYKITWSGGGTAHPGEIYKYYDDFTNLRDDHATEYGVNLLEVRADTELASSSGGYSINVSQKQVKESRRAGIITLLIQFLQYLNGDIDPKGDLGFMLYKQLRFDDATGFQEDSIDALSEFLTTNDARPQRAPQRAPAVLTVSLADQGTKSYREYIINVPPSPAGGAAQAGAPLDGSLDGSVEVQSAPVSPVSRPTSDEAAEYARYVDDVMTAALPLDVLGPFVKRYSALLSFHKKITEFYKKLKPFPPWSVRKLSGKHKAKRQSELEAYLQDRYKLYSGQYFNNWISLLGARRVLDPPEQHLRVVSAQDNTENPADIHVEYEIDVPTPLYSPGVPGSNRTRFEKRYSALQNLDAGLKSFYENFKPFPTGTHPNIDIRRNGLEEYLQDMYKLYSGQYFGQFITYVEHA